MLIVVDADRGVSIGVRIELGEGRGGVVRETGLVRYAEANEQVADEVTRLASLSLGYGIFIHTWDAGHASLRISWRSLPRSEREKVVSCRTMSVGQHNSTWHS
jgi:hypothetical protein